MSIVQLVLIAFGLSMDAFAASVSDGLATKRVSGAFAAAALFGAFQAIMPAAGYFVGAGFAQYIARFDHFIALGALGFIGTKAIIESVCEISEHKRGEHQQRIQQITLPLLLAQAFATSIDALMAGVSFAAVGTNPIIACAVIGAVTFALCVVGGLFGRCFGEMLGAKASIAGGAVLILIGIKTAAEHILFGA